MVTLLLFASVRDAACVQSLAVPIPADDPTVGGIWREACRLAPALSHWTDRVALARNDAYAALTDPVQDGDELAAIPPVSGG